MPAEETNRTNEQPKKVNFLVLEDDEDVNFIISQLATSFGHTVISVYTGSKALEVLRGDQVEAVLSDIMVPDMNGLEVLRRCQAFGNDAPFAFISGFQDSAAIRAAVRLGAFDFVFKPFDNSELEFVMWRLLLIARRNAELTEHIEQVIMKQVPEIGDRLSTLLRQIRMLRVVSNKGQRKG